MASMRTAVLATLTLSLFASFGDVASAADLYPNRSYGERSRAWRAAADWPRLRVVEQVPYCGDCDNLIGRPSGPKVRLRFIGYLPWTRGCALCGRDGRGTDYGWFLGRIPRPGGKGGWG